MRTNEIIGPVNERLLGVSQRETKYYINPRYSEIMAVIKRPSHSLSSYYDNTTHEMRGYMIGGNLYVWPAYHDIHIHGRESLHREFGIGKDVYSGRPLVIRLMKDGTLQVLLGGIRKGYFVAVGEATIDKFARLKAAVTPPQADPSPPQADADATI
jgi:hypothetical protein